jgi:hypothetical protein
LVNWKQTAKQRRRELQMRKSLGEDENTATDGGRMASESG